MFGDDMDHAGGALQLSSHADQPGTEHYWAILLEDARPDNRVGNAGFIFQRHEDDIALPRPLSNQHETGNGHAIVGDDLGQTLMRDNAAPVEVGAQKGYRMRLQ